MPVEMRYVLDKFGALIAYPKDDSYGLVAQYLSSDLQTPASCDSELSWIEMFEKSDEELFVGSGNSTRRILKGDQAHFYFVFDNPDEIDPITVTLVDLKVLIKEWKNQLSSHFQKKKKK